MDFRGEEIGLMLLLLFRNKTLKRLQIFFIYSFLRIGYRKFFQLLFSNLWSYLLLTWVRWYRLNTLCWRSELQLEHQSSPHIPIEKMTRQSLILLLFSLLLTKSLCSVDPQSMQNIRWFLQCMITVDISLYIVSNLSWSKWIFN